MQLLLNLENMRSAEFTKMAYANKNNANQVVSQTGLKNGHKTHDEYKA